MYKTIIEPFRIKSAEKIRLLTRQERQVILKEAHYNLFAVAARDVTIDLLTDSGTGAMSAKQWAAMMLGDESYAGSDSFFRFEKVVKDLTGFQFVIPTHQGRAAESILFHGVGGQGKVIPNNTHFDTTRANVEHAGAEAVDLATSESRDLKSEYPFKGNMDCNALEELMGRLGPEKIPVVMMTVTNNSMGGQPVSMANLKKTSEICRAHHIPLFLDACRFAENAYFIKTREEGYQNHSVEDIARKMFRLCDGCTMSAKKDGLVNIGGFLALNDSKWAEYARNDLILTEGFPTYGGLSGRDLEAIAQGLQEVLEEDYLKYRCRSTAYLVNNLAEGGVPVLLPPGGHAVYIDAGAFLPHIRKEEFPGQALACELYLEGGIRGVEVGTLMFAAAAKERPELLRLALPRRTYTQSHIDYVIEIVLNVCRHREAIRGLRITYEAPILRHFTARLEPLA